MRLPALVAGLALGAVIGLSLSAQADPCLSGEQLGPYLASTPLITTKDPAVHELAQRLKAQAPYPRDQAVAIHNWVRDEIPFGFNSKFHDVTAAEVLRSKTGFCHTKTTLFLALLRSAGIPARPKFVTIDGKLLEGYTSRGAYIDHSFAEVYLDCKWIPLDSYVLDLPLLAAAEKKLKLDRKDIGYGTVIGATGVWDGYRPAFSQYVTHPSAGPYPVGHPLSGRAPLSNRDFGDYKDVADFYARAKGTMNGGFITRAVFYFFAPSMNRTIRRIRTDG